VRDTARIRVAIIEGQPIFGKALALLLSKDALIEVVCELQQISVPALSRHQPEVIIVDLDGVDGDFVAGIAQARSICPGARICVLTGLLQPEVLLRCMRAGAEGYVLKDTTAADLIGAIHAIASGSSYVDPRVAGSLLRRSNASPRSSMGDQQLSPREAEVVKLIAEGLANREISARLSLSEKTVKNYVNRIFSKLNITARTQAAVYAIRTGMI